MIPYCQSELLLDQPPSTIFTSRARSSQRSDTEFRSFFWMSQERTVGRFESFARERCASFLSLCYHGLLRKNRYCHIVFAYEISRWNSHMSRTSGRVEFCCLGMGLEFRHPILLFLLRQTLEEMVCRIIDMYKFALSKLCLVEFY